MKFRNDIQGLRAIAVLFVFIFHLSHTYLPGGFIGVDMFFVISGYLISKIVHSKINKGSFGIIDFYIGRVKRIVPAYYFLLIICWITFLFIFAPSDIGKFKLAHFHTILFNSNNYFARVDDYFGASSNENPFLHTWTLAVEMQFYFILPLLLLFIRNLKYLLITLIVISAALFGFSTYEIFNGNKATMYFSLLARSPEFFLGVIFALSRIEEKTFIKNNSNVISVIGLITLILSAVFLTEQSPFPGVTSLIPCLGIGMILISPMSKINYWISNKTFVYLGEISYSVYLWHWPIMAFYRYYTQSYDFGPIETISIILLTVICSLFSYYLIEKPFRKLNGKIFYVPLFIMGVANVLMVVFISKAKLKFSDIPSTYIFPSFGLSSHAGDFKGVETLGGKNLIGKRVLFVGDSHALTLKPFLDTLGKKHNFSFRTVTNNVYPTIPNIPLDSIQDKERRNIYEKLSPVIIKEFEEADIVFLTFFSKEGARWVKYLEKVVENIKPDQKLLLISDYPVIDKNPVRSNKDFIKNRTLSITYKKEFNKMPGNIIELFSKKDNLKFIDLSVNDSFFVDAPFYNDTLMYYDNTHLNKYGSIKYAEINEKVFMDGLNWAIK